MLTAAIDEAYKERLEAELSECDVQIRELRDRVERMLANVEVQHYRRIEALRNRERAIRDKLQSLSGQSDLPIQPVQADIQSELDSLKLSIAKALEEYR